MKLKHQLAQVTENIASRQTIVSDLRKKINDLTTEVANAEEALKSVKNRLNQVEVEKVASIKVLLGSVDYNKLLEDDMYIFECIDKSDDFGMAATKAVTEMYEEGMVMQQQISNLEYDIGVLTLQKTELEKQKQAYMDAFNCARECIMKRRSELQGLIQSKAQAIVTSIAETETTATPSETFSFTNAVNIAIPEVVST